ncbi:MAG: citrate/2-methylcitrate synthase [Anaerolineae bacterium]|jgi:ATP-citrate lyase alpha-subunit
MRPYQLFDRDTRAIVYGFQTNAVQRMLDFDYVCQRETPSVACMVDPTRNTLHKVFFGTTEILIPVYRSLAEAVRKHPDADVMVNFASARSAFDSTMEALGTDTLDTIAVIAEGVPERQARIMAADARRRGKWIIGPATVGGLVAGAFKIGNTAGTVENIIDTKLYRPGSVGFVSKSGGMSNESYNIISRNSDGILEGIAIGGDRYPGSTLYEHLERYERNPDIKMLVMLGEVGGVDEYEVVEAIESGKLTKPVVAWVTGTCARIFPSELQFGHAGAKAGSARETAEAKNAALRASGAFVPDSFNDFGEMIRETYESLKMSGVIEERPEPAVPEIPMDYAAAKKQGLIRKPANFICTISDERGEEPLYYGVPLSEVVESGMSIGHILGLLWFKKRLPDEAAAYLELCVKLVADHGPAVSGAHNAIVTARAGKDMISALAGGLLTIGPRFGGAINDAARYFKEACDNGVPPDEFVAHMKAKGIRIPGIGHRVKSLENPDVRVKLLKEFVQTEFPDTPYLDYALAVEQETTKKKSNLILNVDGCIGITFLDFMKSSGLFTEEEMDQIVDLGYLNALFVWGRSIGFIGHIFDQYRLKQGLYRHPWDDILYYTEEGYDEA